MNKLIVEALDNYVCHQIETGSFLRAVLENDLQEACARADIQNQKIICDIVHYCFNEIPSTCWGSKEAVQKWLDMEK